MKRSFSTIAMAMSAFALLVPAAAMADDDDPSSHGGYYYFNDGNGTCGYAQETPYGWQIIDTFPCPREVNGG